MSRVGFACERHPSQRCVRDDGAQTRPVCATCWRPMVRVPLEKNPHAVALGRRGGLAGKGKTSPAKAAAARENGKRPKRQRQPKPSPESTNTPSEGSRPTSR